MATYHALAGKGDTMAVFGLSSKLVAAPRIARGFTLIEVMIVVAIVAILAAIALPSYADYVKRGKIIEATTALSDARTRYEQYFLDNRKYTGGCLLFGTLIAAEAKTFTVDCSVGESDTTYAPTATGKASEGMNGFVYQIDQNNNRTSTITAPGWGNAGCGWVTRKDGSCT
jgi:type IV pilus assembly protein PilE